MRVPMSNIIPFPSALNIERHGATPTYATGPRIPGSFRAFLVRSEWRPDWVGDVAREAAKNPAWIRDTRASALRASVPFEIRDAMDQALREYREGFNPIDTAPFPIAGGVYRMQDGRVVTVCYLFERASGKATGWHDLGPMSYRNDYGKVGCTGDIWRRIAQGAVLLSVGAPE